MWTGRIFFVLSLFVVSQSEKLSGAHSDIADTVSDLSRRLENLEHLRTKDSLEAARREEELLSRIQATEDNERQIRDLEQLVSGQFEEIAALRTRLEHLSRLDGVSVEDRPGNSSYSQLDRPSRADVHFPPVAFYAYSSTTLIHLTNRMLPYDTVITNVGNGYSKYTGAFTCSVPGVYFFEWDVYVGGGVGYHVDTELQRNGRAVAFAKAGTTTYLAMTGSSSAILQLAAGDQVWVKVSEVTNDQTVLYNNKTKFSGFLIQ